MVIHFESPGNFNSGIPSFRALISKKGRVNIQVDENKISFQSEIDKIRYEVKLSNIKGYYVRKRNRISIIELKDFQENFYTFFPLLNKYNYRSNSKRLTEDLFRHITRLYIKNEMPILFEAKGAFWEGDPSLSNWKSNLNKGLIFLTENFLSFKPFREENLYQIKILDIKEVLGESKDLDLFIKVITNQDKAFSFLIFKKRLKFFTRDKIKTDRFLELLRQVRIYKSSEQVRLFELEKKRIEKIKSMIRVSNRIKLEMMRVALEMDEKNFADKVFEWAKKFDFVIDGKYLIVNDEKVNDFILSLRVNEMDDTYKVMCPFCENIIEAEVLICPYCGKEIKV